MICPPVFAGPSVAADGQNYRLASDEIIRYLFRDFMRKIQQ
jgi:hypothetical protein